jgi:hypothetical protein
VPALDAHLDTRLALLLSLLLLSLLLLLLLLLRAGDRAPDEGREGVLIPLLPSGLALTTGAAAADGVVGALAAGLLGLLLELPPRPSHDVSAVRP